MLLIFPCRSRRLSCRMRRRCRCRVLQKTRSFEGMRARPETRFPYTYLAMALHTYPCLSLLVLASSAAGTSPEVLGSYRGKERGCFPRVRRQPTLASACWGRRIFRAPLCVLRGAISGWPLLLIINCKPSCSCRYMSKIIDPPSCFAKEKKIVAQKPRASRLLGYAIKGK